MKYPSREFDVAVVDTNVMELLIEFFDMILEKGILEEFTLVRRAEKYSDYIHITWPNGLEVSFYDLISINSYEGIIIPYLTGRYEPKDAISELKGHFSINKIKL